MPTTALDFESFLPAEQWLSTIQGITWQSSLTVPLSMVQPDWRDLENLGRPIAVRLEAVEKYQRMRKSNMVAPAVILGVIGDGPHKGRYRILDGRQRLVVADRAGFSHLSQAYIVQGPCLLLDMIAMTANEQLHGIQEPSEYNKRNTVRRLHLDKGVALAEIATCGGWSVSELQEIATTMKWQEAVTSIGGPELHDTHLRLLNDRTTIKDIRAAAKPVSEFLCSMKTTKLAAQDSDIYYDWMFAPIVKKGRTHATYTERVKEIKSDPEIDAKLNGRRGTSQKIDIKLRRGMRSVENILKEVIKDNHQLVNLDEFFQLNNKAASLLKTIKSKKKGK